MLITRYALAAASILAISGCVVAPGPYYPAYNYPAYGYGYGYGAPAYYGPAYVAGGPTLAIGIGGGRGHWR